MLGSKGKSHVAKLNYSRKNFSEIWIPLFQFPAIDGENKSLIKKVSLQAAESTVAERKVWILLLISIVQIAIDLW